MRRLALSQPRCHSSQDQPVTTAKIISFLTLNMLCYVCVCVCDQLERFQQTEERLQAILQSQARQSEAGVRLSSKDWAAFRQRLTKQWALRYHKIGR